MCKTFTNTVLYWHLKVTVQHIFCGHLLKIENMGKKMTNINYYKIHYKMKGKSYNASIFH